MDFVETIGRCFAGRKRHGGIDQRWAELKKSVLESAQGHLQGRSEKHRKWMTEDTIEIIEAKRMAFLRWQKQREDAGRHKEYRDLSKRVRRQ